MAKKRKREAPRTVPKVRPRPAKKTPWISIAGVVLALVLAAVPFAIGKYIEFNSPGPFDSGAYVYSAQHILDGARIGIEEKTSARMGTLLVNILGVWIFGFAEFVP